MKTKKKRSRFKGVAKRLPRARKRRKKRRLALAKSLAPLTLRPRYETADRVRGDGPPVRNVESSVLGGDQCKVSTGCTKKAEVMVLWHYWLGGCWRKASRHQCAKHAESLESRIRRSALAKAR